MHRRRFLATFGTGALSVTAGCHAVADRSEETTATDDVPTATAADYPLAENGFPRTICSEEVKDDPGIYAVTDPAFAADWRDVEIDPRYGVDIDADRATLATDQTVIGLAGDPPRAYPVSVLWYHEIVNDDRGGAAGTATGPVVVTYCPLCRSGVVASRVVDGEVTEFRVTGLLWQASRLQSAAAEARNETFGAGRTGTDTALRNNGNLVMTDRATGSYWSQILATAICGPREGTDLTVVPSTVATWDEWRASNPDTEVLLPPPHSEVHTPG